MEEKRKLMVFFAISFTLLTFLIFVIFRPMLNTILLGFVFSFLMYPLYKIIYKKLKNKKVSSFLVCLIFIILFTTPLIIGLNNLAQEAFSASRLILDSDIINNLGDFECESETVICEFFNRIFVETNFRDILKDIIRSSATFFTNYIGGLLLKLPVLVLNAFIIIFMMYYLLMDGKKFMQRVYTLLPISNRHKHKLFLKTFNNLSGILFGTISVAVIQGTLAGIGFAIFGFRSPILWGFLTIFFALVPMFGAGIVWFPASVYKIFESYSASDTFGIWMGIGLFFYGAIIVSTLDNFIRPLLVSGKTKIHPVLVLFGIIGGVSVFGAAGIFIGPLILGIFLTLLEMFEEEKNFLFSTTQTINTTNIDTILNNTDINNNIEKNKINSNAKIINNKSFKKNTKSAKKSKSSKIFDDKKDFVDIREKETVSNYCQDYEKMPDGMSCLITKKDYNLLQEYKETLNESLRQYLNKLKIPVIGLQKLSKKKNKIFKKRIRSKQQ